MMDNATTSLTRDTKFETKGIVSALSKIGFIKKNYFRSISEYIWNGFDAEATIVELIYEISQVKNQGSFRKVMIKDNGKGIAYNSSDGSFQPIFDSERLTEDYSGENHSAIHGKNGIGRLTFYTFCNFAKWTTVFNDGESKKYEITINANKLNKFKRDTNTLKVTKEETGTIVEFSGFEKIKQEDIESNLLNHLKREFAWYLELHPDFKLIVNSQEINYDSLIADRDSLIIKYQDKEEFKIRYIKWKQLMNKEYSKFYYLNSAGVEVWKENTKLNNQGDEFYHSIYVESKYFNNFNFLSQEEPKQTQLSGGARFDEEFKYFSEKIYAFLRRKRKPFLQKYSVIKLKEYKAEGIIKTAKEGTLEAIETHDLESVFKNLYKLQPKFFAKLKKEQKKIIIGFLQLVLTSHEREKIIDLIGEIVKLDESERRELSELLKVTELNKILKTTTLIKDRFAVVEVLKQLVYNKDLKANERDHIQKIIEENYWLFGEQYSLVTKDENFQKALEKYAYILRGEKKPVKFNGESKLKRMDIFLCQRRMETKYINNVIVELKNPSIKLGKKEHGQVIDYKNAILDEAQFKSDSAKWDFILIGNDYDKFIQSQIDTNKNHGELNLIFSVDNFKVYVKRWADVFDEFYENYQFLNSKLELRKEVLVTKLTSADEGVKKANKN